MKYLFYTFTYLVLILIQTTIIHHFRVLSGFYDLFIVIVIYLGLYRNLRESIPVILFLGITMDNLYNGPFGLYMTVYLWLYAAIRWSSVYFHVRNKLFLVFAVASGVLFENLVFIASFVVFNPDSQLPGNIPENALGQILWAFLTGPFFLVLINRAYNTWSGGVNPHVFEQSGHV
ncbi:MAG: hypothetical protein KKD92_02770 [Proteobacteria bacterium]|nr:hypothetical protein [Pseudomonadota bacterium]